MKELRRQLRRRFLTDPAMISAIQIAFYQAGVLLDYEPANIDNNTFGVSLPGGWVVGAIGGA